MKSKGVTLVEMLIVTLVISIISVFSVPAIGTVLANIEKESVLNSANSVENAAKLYCSQTILDDCKVGDTLDYTHLERYLDGVDLSYTYTATKTESNHWSVIYTKEDALSFPFDALSQIIDLQVPSLSEIASVNLSTYGGGNTGGGGDDGGGGEVDPPTGVPYVELLGDATVYVEIASTYNDAGVVAYDSAGNVISSTWIEEDNVDLWSLGTYTRTFGCYSNLDGRACEEATRTVVVQDTTAPVIYINGDSTFYIKKNRTYSDWGAYALDNSSESISITTSGANINTSSTGTHYVTYTASDSSGNTATATRTVIVRNGGGGW